MICQFTLPQSNSEFTPENRWFEDDPASFLGLRRIFRCHVSFREGNIPIHFVQREQKTKMGLETWGQLLSSLPFDYTVFKDPYTPWN